MHELRFYASLMRTFLGANLQRGITLCQKAADIFFSFFLLKVLKWYLRLNFDLVTFANAFSPFLPSIFRSCQIQNYISEMSKNVTDTMQMCTY